MTALTVARRATYLIACVAPAWAAIAFISDGVVWRVGPLRVSSTEPLRPLAIGSAAAMWYGYRWARDYAKTDGAWLSGWISRTAYVTTPFIIIAGCYVGIRYGAFAAAGSDAYGYVSQAELWLRGDLRVEQPIVGEVSWPNAAWTFTPLGYRPVSDLGTIAPTYPPGLPTLMAGFQRAFGRQGVFFVVPLLSSVALAATYMLGVVTTGSRNAGALAALLLLVSPAFLSHSMLPMSDVPVTAGWALACVCALREPAPRPLLAGLAAGASALIRPNLIPLAAAPIGAWLVPIARNRSHVRAAMRRVLVFAAGLAPALIAIALINHALFGSIVESGYGRLSDLYDHRALPQNVRNYGAWLISTQTPLVVLALVPLVLRSSLRTAGESSPAACLALLGGLVGFSYAFYYPFDNWTYLRFLLPAYPAMFVLMAAGVRGLSARIPSAFRPAVAMVFTALVVSTAIQFAKDQRIFEWGNQEARYVRAAQHVSDFTPDGAMVFASQHSGSIRYHADRMTLRYDLLPPDSLDAAVRELRGKGTRSFLVIDEWELDGFSQRFAGSRAGVIAGRPLARIAGPPDVLIFELRVPPE